jgi:hypothetical protein
MLLFDEKIFSQIIRKERREIKPGSPRFFHTLNPWVLTHQPLNFDDIPVHYKLIP